jgi:diapolycopene oxygenase
MTSKSRIPMKKKRVPEGKRPPAGNAAVIGSGIGGLAAAIRLARKGYDVTVFEKNPKPGGKLGEIKYHGYRFDTGPSLLTLPELIDELFEITGHQPSGSLTYHKLRIACKYFYENGKILTAWADQKKFIRECVEKLGEKPENIKKHLDSARKIYQLTSELFLFNSLHKPSNYLRKSSFQTLYRIHHLRFYRTMHRENQKSLSAPELVQLFDRYATYNGSNPYQAPATLNIIAHLENNLGVYFPVKGMYSIIQSLYELALQQKVTFRFQNRVSEIILKNKRATGIRVDQNILPFDLIVSDVDVRYMAGTMIRNYPLAQKQRKIPPSSSALIFYWGIKKQFPQLEAHNILFSNDYRKEFESLFTKKTIDDDPTVYLFISSRIVPGDAPEGCENWFVLVNAPADENQNWPSLIHQTRANSLRKINRILHTDIRKYIEFEKIASPLTIEEDTLSMQGALYGNSSNSLFSAFLRHPNFLRSIKNLYFTGGSVHPGGGIPLCLASARIVDQEIPVIP